jgi:hypothetical protein
MLKIIYTPYRKHVFSITDAMFWRCSRQESQLMRSNMRNKNALCWKISYELLMSKEVVYLLTQ